MLGIILLLASVISLLILVIIFIWDKKIRLDRILKSGEAREKERDDGPRLPTDCMYYRDRKVFNFSDRVNEIMWDNAIKTGKLRIDNDDVDKAFEEALKQEIVEINKDRSN